MKYTPQEKAQIGVALIELERSKGGKLIPEATKLFFANEFENLGWHIAKVLNAIKSAIYDNTYSDVKFSDFVDRENDDLIPQDLVLRKAMDTIKAHQEKFRLFCSEYYGTTLLSREQVSKILDLLNKNEISHYDLQSTKKNIEWLKGEEQKVKSMTENLLSKKDELRNAMSKLIEDVYENANIPDDDKKASAESVIYLAIKDLNKSL